MLTWIKPVEGEYLPYQKAYLDKVPQGDLIEILKTNGLETDNFLRAVSEEKADYRYADGKWSIREILQHLIDVERIMCYRALCFARMDTTELPGFEQDDYVAHANTSERVFATMLDEFVAVRNATIYLFESFNDEILKRKGIANKGTVTVNTIAHTIAGHELHHLVIIKEKYFETENSR